MAFVRFFAMRGFFENHFNELASLNPSVAALGARVSENSFRDILLGVASLLNPADIHFFVEIQELVEGAPVALLSTANSAYRALDDAVYSRTGIDRSWVASPETLGQIWERVKDRPVQHRDLPLNAFRKAALNIACRKELAPANDFISTRVAALGVNF